MSTLTFALSRAAPRVAALSGRALSTQTTDAVAKLRTIVDEYRQANYSEELPSRIKKDVVRAAARDTRSGAAVDPDGLRRVLRNIGAGEHRLSPREVQSIFDELGDDRGLIAAPRFVQLI